MCCSVLRCVIVCCSVLRCVEDLGVVRSTKNGDYCVSCSVLQLQCIAVAVCCSELRCVIVCCSVSKILVIIA